MRYVKWKHPLLYRDKTKARKGTPLASKKRGDGEDFSYEVKLTCEETENVLTDTDDDTFQEQDKPNQVILFSFFFLFV